MANFVTNFDKDHPADKGAKTNPTTRLPYNYDYFKESLIMKNVAGENIIFHNFDEFRSHNSFHLLNPQDQVRMWILTKLAYRGVKTDRANIDREIYSFFEKNPQYKSKDESLYTKVVSTVNPATGHMYTYNYYNEPLLYKGIVYTFDEYLATPSAQELWNRKNMYEADKYDVGKRQVIAGWIIEKLHQKGVEVDIDDLSAEIDYYFINNDIPLSFSSDQQLINNPFIKPEILRWMDENNYTAKDSPFDSKLGSARLEQVVSDLGFKVKRVFDNHIPWEIEWHKATRFKYMKEVYENQKQDYDTMKASGEMPVCVIDWLEHPEKGLTYEDVVKKLGGSLEEVKRRLTPDEELRNELKEMYSEPTEEEKQKWKEKFGSNK